MKKIVIAGGTGFIGKYLQAKFDALQYHVVIISRQKVYVQWNDKSKLIEAVNGAELLLNLAGKSVNCRYNEKNKAEIINSRTETTRLLSEVILQCAQCFCAKSDSQ